MYLHNTLLKSTIFRTITDESTGAVKSIGLFGKSITDLRDSLNSIRENGVLNTIFNTSTIDEKKVNEYNNAIKNGTNAQEALAQASVETNKATINLIKSANGATVSTEALTAAQKKSTVASKALSVGLKALSVAGNMLLMWGISLAIKGIIKGFDALITTTEEHQEQLQNLQQEYDEAKQNLEEVNSQISEYEKRINELQGKTLTPVEEEELQRIQNLNEQLKIEKEVLEEIERIKKGETSDKAIETINSKKGGMTRMEMIEDYAHSGYVNTQKEIDRIMSADYMTSEEKNYEIKYLREHQDSLRQQALEISSELLEEAKALDQNNAEAKELYDKIQALSAETLTWAKDVDTATNSVNENSNATSNASENANKMTVSLSDLEGASDKISKLSSAFKELSDDGYITTKTLGEIQEATGLSGDEWEQYRDKLIGAKAGSSEFNQAMDELTYKMLDNAFAGRDLNSVTEEEIALLLKENGVSNSTAVAHDYLTRAKLSAKIATIDWNNATEEQIQSLYIMAQQCGITAQGMDILTQTMSILSNTDLNLADKCSALLEMAAAAGIAAASVGTASYAISEIKKGSVAGFHMLDSGGKSLDSLYESSIDEVVKTIFNKYSSLSVDIKPPKYTSGGSKGSNGSNKSDKSPFDDSYYSTVEAQIADDEKKIEALEKDREALNAKFEHAMDVGNKEQAEILRTKLSENVKAQKDILAGQNILNRGTQAELLNSLYELAPTLSGKSWDEISEVELTELENSLNKASELASDDDSKNNSKLALNKFKGIVSDLKALDDAMKDNSEAWQKLDEDSKGYWQSQIDFQEDYSKSWIDNQKSFDRMRDDEELAAYRRMIENNKNFQKQILNDISLSEEAKLALIKETNEKINEYEKESYELEKNIVSDILSLSKSRIDSTESILQSHYDVTNSIAEAQHEINKELKASKTMYEWLDENTRKLLFNQEDYNILSNKLVNIQGEAEKLQRRYNQEVLNSTSNNLDAITSKYQMQYETLMKTYEIAKAELEVAKKRQQLDNVLNERNVRMLIDGKWRWVANTQDVINAQNELADAEYQAQQAKLEKNQTDSLNNLTKATDRLTTITNQISDGEINIRDITGNISSSLGGIATKSVPALKDIIDETKDALKNLVSDIGGEKSSNTQSYSAKSGSLSKANASATIPGVGTVGVHINQSGKTTTKGLPVGTVVHTSGGDYKITGSDSDNYTSIKVKNAYANGTNHTKSGTALMGENGYEVFIDKDGNLIPVEQPTIFKDIEAGGKVFNAMQMRNLNALWNLSNIGFNPNNIPSMVDRVQAVSSDDNSTHYHGDIIIQNPADFNDFTQKLTKAIKMRAPITKNMPR